MADSAQLEMPGSSGQSKVPGWLMVVGAIAGVAGLVLLLKGNQGGGTTAAGTSINAALGSIQEENMNLLGVTQAGFMQTGQEISSSASYTNDLISSTSQQNQTQMAQGFTQTIDALTKGFLNTQNSFGSLGTQVNTGFANTYGLIGTLEHDITAQMSAFSGQSQQNYVSLFNLIASGQASQAQVDSYQNSLLSSLQQDVTSGLVGQQQANSVLSTIETQIAALKASGATVTASSGGGGGGGGSVALVHTYTVNLPGGGQIHTNSTSAAGALNNVPGGHF